jgi:hypothetical protein
MAEWPGHSGQNNLYHCWELTVHTAINHYIDWPTLIICPALLHFCMLVTIREYFWNAEASSDTELLWPAIMEYDAVY